MNTQQHIISTRDFMRHFSAITETKEEYLIIKHGKPIGIYTPVEPPIKTNPSESSPESQKRMTLEDLKKYRFTSEEKNLSERIDEIVYGIGRDSFPD